MAVETINKNKILTFVWQTLFQILQLFKTLQSLNHENVFQLNF